MRRFLVLTLAASSLAACASPQAVSVPRPPLVTYSAAQQKKLAAELRALPDDSIIDDFITDYGKLRDAVRVGQK
jgi:hypothetical protein